MMLFETISTLVMCFGGVGMRNLVKWCKIVTQLYYGTIIGIRMRSVLYRMALF